MHRFHRLWIDLDEDQFAGLPAERLFLLLERLAAYDGAVAARIHQIMEDEKKRNPSRQAADAPDTVHVPGTTENLRNHPDFAGLIEVETV